MQIFDEREEQESAYCRRSSVDVSSSDSSSLSSESDSCYPVGLSYSPLSDYATTVQHNQLYRGYKEDIYNWLLTNSIALNCPRCVVYRAANYMDRLLSVVCIGTSSLEGVSWLCFYLAQSVGGFRNHLMTYQKICDYFKDEYQLDKNGVSRIIQHILKVLGFRLMCPCPYTMCYRELEKKHCTHLCDSAFVFMDCICKRYNSIAISEVTKKIAVLYVLSYLEFGNDSLVSVEDKKHLLCYSGVSLCFQMISESYPEMHSLLSSIVL